MNKEQAAKMLIVGWVKNWNMRTVLNAITEKNSDNINDEEILNFHNKYAFMPKNIWAYLSHRGSGVPVRKFIYDNYRKLNDALWDTDDNKVRLSFASYLISKKCQDVNSSSLYEKEDKDKNRKATRDYSGFVKSKAHYKDIFDKSSGHHWFTVK